MGLDLTAFVEALDPSLRDRYAAVDLESALARLVDDAGVTGDDLPQFLRDVAMRVDADVPPETALGAIRAADLVLATACARGEAAAIARFDREMAPHIAAAFGRYRGLPISLDELRQAMRERLLVVAGGAAPRIASYLGRGDLRAWVRMATIRHLLDTVRSDAARPEHRGGDDALAELATRTDDPELAFLKQTYRADFKVSFATVLATLDARDRNILRHRYLDGLEVAEIATIYGMHRVSLSRVLARIRDELLSGIRREFLKRQGLGADELDGIMALIGSQLELSLSGLLKR